MENNMRVTNKKSRRMGTMIYELSWISYPHQKFIYNDSIVQYK